MSEAAPTPRPARMGAGGHVAIALAVALLGFLLATQLRVQESLGERLAIERESDLARILSDLTARSDALLEEIVELRVRLAETRGSAAQEEVLLRNAREELDAVRILLGAVAVEGEGVTITIDDPDAALGPDVLLDVIQELRDAGAEAIEVNRVRVVAQTSFSGEPGAVRAGDRPLRRPYLVRAIGARATLAEAMRIPGGVVDSIESRPGASVRVREVARLRIAALHRPRPFSYARATTRR